ncbi:MAG: hypothetical protein RIM99_13970 [Cyclobacteriaceae bacterium]
MKINAISDAYYIKGTGYKNLKKYLDTRYEPGLFEHAAGEVGIQFNGGILTVTKYPIFKYIQLCQSVAEKVNKSLEDLTIDSSRFVLEEDLNGIYKFFIRVGGPERTIHSFPQITKTYCNFVRYHIEDNKSGSLILRGETVAEINEWNKVALKGAMTGILNVCKRPIKTFEVANIGELDVDGDRFIITKIKISY